MITGPFELNLPAPLVTDLNKRIITFFYALFGTLARNFDTLHLSYALGLCDAQFSTGRSPEKSLIDNTFDYMELCFVLSAKENRHVLTRNYFHNRIPR